MIKIQNLISFIIEINPNPISPYLCVSLTNETVKQTLILTIHAFQLKDSK